MSAFKDAPSIWNVISGMLYAEQPRALNRARVNDLFNGNPPFTEAEARDNRIGTNVNFLEGTRIVHNARGMFENALLKPSNFFNVKLDIGPRGKRDEWANIITSKINRPMKRSKKYNIGLKGEIAGVVLHGIGPSTWMRDRDWCPKFRGVEDFLVPSGTLTDCSNLDHFAIYTTFTAAELQRMSSGPDEGWNKPLVETVLQRLREKINVGGDNWGATNFQFPEKTVEDFKENSGWWGSDRVPVVRCYDFYYLDTDSDNPTWRRRIVLDQWSSADVGDGKSQFLFDPGDRNYGNKLQELMHVQFANGSVVAPFRWHSVRSLGYLLYAVCHLNNRLRCKFTDAVFESMLWYFRNVAEGDKERLEKVDFRHLGTIPDGLSWVPASERHTINFELLNGAMAGNRQLMAESSATYQQDPDTGTQKEQTATEVMAKVQSANALVGSFLTDAYFFKNFQYEEIARRFCKLDHADCKRFRDECQAEGVDPAVFDVEGWIISPEKAMGNGNKILQIAQADKLMAVRPMLPPQGQTIVLHQYVEANSDDPHLADQIVPLVGSQISMSVEKATFSWGTLVTGLPVALGPEVNRVEYIDTLIKMVTAELQNIEVNGGMTNMEKVQELGFVVRFVKQQVAIIAQDKSQEGKVSEWMDLLGRIENELKGYAQRIVEQEAAAQKKRQQGADHGALAESQAKVQATVLKSQTDAQIKESKAAQAEQHKEAGFQQEQARKNQSTVAETQRKNVETASELATSQALANQEIENSKRLAAARAAGKAEE